MPHDTKNGCCAGISVIKRNLSSYGTSLVFGSGLSKTIILRKTREIYDAHASPDKNKNTLMTINFFAHDEVHLPLRMSPFQAYARKKIGISFDIKVI